MENKRNLYIALGLAGVAVLILAGGLVYKFWGGDSGAGEEVKFEKVEAPKGQLVNNFPRDLMVEADPLIKESYSLTYEKESQPAVNYFSRFSVDENLKLFRDRLKTIGYKITKDEKLQEGIYQIYAIRGSENVNITVVRTDPKAMVNVIMAYVKM
jgi:hypothetical protein